MNYGERGWGPITSDECILVIWSRSDGSSVEIPQDDPEDAKDLAEALSLFVPSCVFTVSYRTSISFEHYETEN